jgi:hypothetical protein
LIRPSGVIRAKASAGGIALPRAGSFQDAVLQEMLFRDQNLKYAEVSLTTRLFERMIFLLVELTTDSEQIVRRKQAIHDDVNLWLKLYEAELFQDRYMPEYQREERERARLISQRQAEEKIREAEALKKVAAFSEDK